MADRRIYSDADWRTLDSLKARNLTQLNGISEQMNADIVRELSEGINAGEGMDKLADRLQTATGMSRNRAENMARTETIQAAVDGAVVRYEQYGVEEVDIVAEDDSRTCMYCAERDGKTVSITDRGNLPPYHVKCRCGIKARLKPRKPEEKVEPPKIGDTTKPFTQRDDLTNSEKTSLASYQDIGNPQHNWDVGIPKGVDGKNDCYVINQSLREPKFYDSLSKHDREVVNKLMSQMDTAIEKSTVQKQTEIIRGLGDPSWLEKHTVGSDYIDRAYGSFTLDAGVASKFAGKNTNGEKVYLIRKLDAGSKAVYMGTKEEEMLVSRGVHYMVTDIIRTGEGDNKAILYYIKEV